MYTDAFYMDMCNIYFLIHFYIHTAVNAACIHATYRHNFLRIYRRKSVMVTITVAIRITITATVTVTLLTSL